MRESLLRAAVGVLAPASLAAGTLLLAGQFSRGETDGIAVPVLPYPLVVGFLVIIGASILAGAARFLALLFRQPSKRRTPPPWQMVGIVLVAFAVVGVVYLVFALILSFFQPPEEATSGLLPQSGKTEELEELPEEETPEEEITDAVDPEERSPLAALLGTALAVVAAAVVGIGAYRRYSSRPDAEESEHLDRLTRDLRDAGARGLERMLEEPDDRRAVIAAYALVEEALELHGYPHESSQTPVEFMEATLAALASEGASSSRPDALLRLTRLYEVAKFSEHPVGERERREAVRCMREISSSFAGEEATRTPYRRQMDGSGEH